MSVPWAVAAIVAGAWLFAALFQLGDIVTAFLDSRTARDRDIPGRIARERTNQLFWIIPIAALISLVIGVGVDHAGRLFFDAQNPAIGSLFLLGVAVLVVGMGGLTLVAVAATDRGSYAALRRELRDLEGEKLPAARVAEFRARLAKADERTRSRMRPTRLLLSTSSILRLTPIVVGLFVLVAVWVAVALVPNDQTASLVFVAALAPVLSAVFAVLGIRFSLLSDIAWRRVYGRQRADIIGLLEGLERTSRKGVAGLGDRVARALQILREQQPQ
ncbi:MAG: hypothetical protein JWR36_929 [Glaciihabitans sp.]|nr:hypothetical protein [Glaciihabitans sp.]